MLSLKKSQMLLTSARAVDDNHFRLVKGECCGGQDSPSVPVFSIKNMPREWGWDVAVGCASASLGGGLDQSNACQMLSLCALVLIAVTGENGDQVPVTGTRATAR